MQRELCPLDIDSWWTWLMWFSCKYPLNMATRIAYMIISANSDTTAINNAANNEIPFPKRRVFLCNKEH